MLIRRVWWELEEESKCIAYMYGIFKKQKDKMLLVILPQAIILN